MSGEKEHTDLWRLPTYLLWLCLLCVGLAPEILFQKLRDFGMVVPHKAIINSPTIITVCFSLFMAFFVYKVCCENGLANHEAQSRGTQIGLFGLLAFIDMPYEGAFLPSMSLLELVLSMNSVSNLTMELKMIVISAGLMKFAIWLYLLSLITRYYIFGNERVFANMLPVFPGTVTKENDTEDDISEEDPDHEE